MKKTKFLGKTFDNNWKCVHVGVASVTRAYYKGTKRRTLTAGHRNYYYLFVRETSDGKFDKMIRLSGYQATNVYHNRRTVESYADKKESISDPNILEKVGYYFKKQ